MANKEPGVVGRDELNFAEWSITLLSNRVPKGLSVIEVVDKIRDKGTGQEVTRKLTVSPSAAYGLPTAHDEEQPSCGKRSRNNAKLVAILTVDCILLQLS